jgi:adenylate cyclase
LQRLRAIRTELLDPKLSEHHGRIVKTAGDGMLVEFSSVVDAVRCAGEVQREMAERNANVAAEQRIAFRIGIHQGDVVVEDGDIFGDGVNIAARLEGLAELGGICVSARVQEDSAGRLDLAFRDLGEQQLKNIARPVRAYAIDAAPVRLAGPAMPAAPRLSIVVLPFANLSNDPKQEYFADALTEDLTTDLSRIDGMFVIARGSAFTYKGKAADPKQIGRELGVRYVLEGGVRKLGARIRINAQLIDAETAGHLWAERFDRDTADLFAVQDEIAGRIAIELNLNLLAAVAAKPAEHPTALDYYLRARAAGMAPPSPERDARVIGLLEQALELDPQSVAIRSRLAGILTGRVAEAANIERARVLAESALALSPRDPLAHFARAQVLRALGRWQEAAAEYEASIAGNRNFALAYSHLAQCRIYSGAIDEAIPLAERAIRLSPRDPNIVDFYLRIGQVHLLRSRVDEAIAWFEKACAAAPLTMWPHTWLAAAYALAGHDARAASELAEARSRVADNRVAHDRYSSLARLRAAGQYATAPGNWGVPKIRALCEATLFAVPKSGGLPTFSRSRNVLRPAPSHPVLPRSVAISVASVLDVFSRPYPSEAGRLRRGAVRSAMISPDADSSIGVLAAFTSGAYMRRDRARHCEHGCASRRPEPDPTAVRSGKGVPGALHSDVARLHVVCRCRGPIDDAEGARPIGSGTRVHYWRVCARWSRLPRGLHPEHVGPSGRMSLAEALGI